ANPSRAARGSTRCPACGRPADNKVVVEELKKQGLWGEWAVGGPPPLRRRGGGRRDPRHREPAAPTRSRGGPAVESRAVRISPRRERDELRPRLRRPRRPRGARRIHWRGLGGGRPPTRVSVGAGGGPPPEV